MAQTTSELGEGGFQEMTQRLPAAVQRIVVSDDTDLRMLNMSKELWAAASNREERVHCINMMISASHVMDDTDGLAAEMTGWGFTAYRNKELDVAQHAFSQAGLLGSISAMSNLAYMLRRGETASAVCGPREIVELLLNGVVERDEYACVNLALTLALLVGDTKAWEYADKRIMSRVTSDEPVAWWMGLARRGETEGFLVLAWLMRRGLLRNSPLGTQEELAKRVFARIPTAPLWLAQPAEETK